MSREGSSKKAMRTNATSALRALSTDERVTASRRVRERLAELDERFDPGVLLGFAPLASEPDISDFLEANRRQGRRILLPRPGPEAGSLEAVPLTCPIEELQRDGMGVRVPCEGAPAPLTEILTVLVPGLMFDTWGQRLGRGGGYYDRLLERLPNARLVGICYECCIGERVPVEPHDRCVDFIVTEDRTIECTGTRQSDG